MCAVVDMEPYFPEETVACLVSSATLGRSSSSLWQAQGGSDKCLKRVFNAGYLTWATSKKLDSSFRTPSVPFVRVQYGERFILSSNLTSVGFGIYATSEASSTLLLYPALRAG